MLAVVLSLYVVVCFVQIAFCEHFFSAPNEDEDSDWKWMNKMALSPQDLPLHPTGKVSVIICAHNESENLERNLPQILEQDYCDEHGDDLFEVIVVNDCSTDNTAQLLLNLSNRNPHLKTITISADEKREFPSKKFALSRGLAACSNSIILMTDADCSPESGDWIKWMSFPFSKEIDIVGGYGGYTQRKCFLNSFIECETIHTFAQYSGYCRRGKPYMAVGRNLACRRSLMEEAMLHPLWKATVSGDDDMLIRLCATPGNMVVNSHPDSHTYSEAKQSWREYLHQKQRHMSTGKYYSASVKRLLGIYAFTHASFWICFILMIVNLRMLLQLSVLTNMIFIIACFATIFRIFCFYSVMIERSEYLSGNKRLKHFWFIFDFAWMLYNFFFAPYILWKNKQTWK